ncbi:hypothetical protein [Labrys monachus]|uniref:Uncharacterized protein n=1 Tax=Labrys monachus TaxID=217067 RepID=A0ABU0F7S9_9HYPH|nr:hypothetical protein [Labrys monachus]MDQ0390669.1 hypothetical protein [Labrys monachus]
MFAKSMLALIPVLFAGAASAQSIDNMRGSVLVNHGNGFVLMAAAGPLAIGDTVMARPGARATLNYADGCKVDIIAGTVLTVENVSPCAFLAIAGPEDATAETPDPATTTTTSTTSTSSAGAASAGAASSMSTTAMVAAGLGGLAVVGGVTAAVVVSQENSASP